MKKLITILSPTLLVSIALVASSCSDSDRGTTPQASSTALNGYLKVSAALFQDDLAGAQAAARDVAESGDLVLTAPAKALAEAPNIEAARKEFVALSKQAVALSEGEPGFHVGSCPMVENGLWVQTDTSVKNPYMGQKMPSCGSIKR